MGNLANAQPDSNVQITAGQSMPDDRTINSLVAVEPVDLRTYRLTVQSGGVFADRITNGELTAGTGGDAELFLHAGRISADIVDNGDGSVTTVITNGRGVTLAGNNTYTGPTIINNTYTMLESTNALPTGSNLVLNSGRIESDGFNRQLGQIVMRGDAKIDGHGSFSFDSLELESGEITFFGLNGDGVIRKSTRSLAGIRSENPDFSGQIVVDGGTLELSAPDAIGVAKVTVNASAVLRAATGRLDNEILLNQGTLHPRTTTVGGTHRCSRRRHHLGRGRNDRGSAR